MSHNFQISDEQYAKLEAYAEEYKETPEKLFQRWINEMIRKMDTLQRFRRKEQTEPEISEEELRNHPLLQIAGILDIGGPGWADRHDEYFAGVFSNEDVPERDSKDILTDLDRLTMEIAPYWPENVDAVEAIRDVRREL